MNFTHAVWEDFCRKLAEENIVSIPACEVTVGEPYLVLKHDVETAVEKAARMADIESRYGHRGSYYVQAYLLKDEKNVELLQKMRQQGHEISYHYDVMDSCKGDIDRAMEEFEENKQLFERNGFSLETVCQHGNPVMERHGYASNRDFFRSEKVQQRFGDLSDIMVDFKRKRQTDYLYFSDAGRQFRLIYDPVNNDIVPSSDKDIAMETMDDMRTYAAEKSCIISVHPHRWAASGAAFRVKGAAFRVIRAVARCCMKVPALKKLMSRFYYLAKKI